MPLVASARSSGASRETTESATTPASELRLAVSASSRAREEQHQRGAAPESGQVTRVCSGRVTPRSCRSAARCSSSRDEEGMGRSLRRRGRKGKGRSCITVVRDRHDRFCCAADILRVWTTTAAGCSHSRRRRRRSSCATCARSSPSPRSSTSAAPPTRLYLSQPALSRQIRALERLVGCELLRRSTHRVELTLAGEALLDRARRLLTDVDEAVSATQSVGGELGARVAPAVGAGRRRRRRRRATSSRCARAYEALHAQFAPPPEVAVAAGQRRRRPVAAARRRSRERPADAALPPRRRLRARLGVRIPPAGRRAGRGGGDRRARAGVPARARAPVPRRARGRHARVLLAASTAARTRRHITLAGDSVGRRSGAVAADQRSSSRACRCPAARPVLSRASTSPAERSRAGRRATRAGGRAGVATPVRRRVPRRPPDRRPGRQPA